MCFTLIVVICVALLFFLQSLKNVTDDFLNCSWTMLVVFDFIMQLFYYKPFFVSFLL